MRLPRASTRRLKLANVTAWLAVISLAAACLGTSSSDAVRYGPAGANSEGGVGGDASAPFGGGGGGAQGGSGGAGGSAGGGGGASGASDGGSSTDGAKADGPAVTCTNSDNTIVTIDRTGLIYPQCNVWGIQGAWYCYADTFGTSNCKMGDVPYSASDAASASGMCISGTTASGTTAYGAGLGFGLNSTTGATPVKSPIADKSIIGFEITLTGGTYGSGGSVINVNMTTGPVAGTYPLVTLPGVAPNSTITYDVFIKDALEPFVANSPTAMPGGLYDLQVAIPQGPPNVQYDYCVTEVKPLTATVAPAGACGSTVAYGPAFCNGLQEYVEELGNVALQNDTFASPSGQAPGGQLCVQSAQGGTSCAGFTATFNGFSPTQANTPGAFPSLVYGWQAGNFYGGYAGGKTVSSLTTATSDWSFKVSGITTYDAAYDIWFAPTQAPATATGGLELMIWLSWVGANPADFPDASLGTATSGTMSFATHKTTINNTLGTWTYLAYLANTQTTSVTGLDLLSLFKDAETRGFLPSGSYLLGVQAGFEVYGANGAAGAPETGSVTTNSFDVNVQ
jgi:hypothetical protein